MYRSLRWISGLVLATAGCTLIPAEHRPNEKYAIQTGTPPLIVSTDAQMEPLYLDSGTPADALEDGAEWMPPTVPAPDRTAEQLIISVSHALERMAGSAAGR